MNLSIREVKNMKRYKLATWLVGGLLITGLVGGAVAFATTSTPAAPSKTAVVNTAGQHVQSAAQDNDKEEVKGVDNDNIQEGQGQQVEDGKPDSQEVKEKGPDTDNIEHESQNEDGPEATGTK